MRETEPGKREERAERRGAGRPEVLVSGGSQKAAGQPRGGPGHVGTWPLLPGVRRGGSEEPPPLQGESSSPFPSAAGAGETHGQPQSPPLLPGPSIPALQEPPYPSPPPALLPPVPRSPCRVDKACKGFGDIQTPRDFPTQLPEWIPVSLMVSHRGLRGVGGCGKAPPPLRPTGLRWEEQKQEGGGWG